MFFNFQRFEPRASRDTAPNLLIRFLKNLGRNIRATAFYFLLGVLLSALFQRYVPAEGFAELFGKRAFEKKYTDSSNIRMYQSIREEYPTIAKCVDEVCKYYNKHWSLELSEEEKLYLIMHVNRVSSKDK